MILDALADINWLAVVIATIAYFMLGFFWYSDAGFGKQWRAALSKSGEDRPDGRAIAINVLMYFLAALGLGLIAKSIGADTFVDGLVLGIVVSFAFIGTNRIVANNYETKNSALMRVNAPYTLLGYALMGVILALMN